MTIEQQINTLNDAISRTEYKLRTLQMSSKRRGFLENHLYALKREAQALQDIANHHTTLHQSISHFSFKQRLKKWAAFGAVVAILVYVGAIAFLLFKMIDNTFYMLLAQLVYWGLVVNFGIAAYQQTPSSSILKQVLSNAGTALLYIACFAGIALILAGIGFVWYYFCGGFLLFPDEIWGESPSFGESIIYFIMSVMLLAWVLGFMAICFGWNPKL